MSFDKHVVKVDGEKRTFHTCNDFWECECKIAFYHAYQDHQCQACGAVKDDQPDATVEEMLEKLNADKRSEFLSRAVIWIAAEDEPTVRDAREMAEMISTQLIAEVFGLKAINVAEMVCALREV